jgi:hypothetical protein
MQITANDMIAKGASDVQVAKFRAACPAGLDTSNLAAVKAAQSGNVDLRWIAKRFSIAGQAYDEAVRMANAAYRAILLNPVTAMPPGIYPTYFTAMKLAELVPAAAPPVGIVPNPVGAAKVAAAELMGQAPVQAAEVPKNAAAAAFVATMAGG